MATTGSEKAIATLAYAFSYAHQRDNRANASGTDFLLDYLAGDVSLAAHDITLGAGFEILEGDGINGFRTPLATAHAFHGHADKFFPVAGFPQGLKDHYVYLGYTIPVGNGIPLRAAYHWFSPESGPGGYGREINLMASYAINKSLGLVTKYGRFPHAAGIRLPNEGWCWPYGSRTMILPFMYSGSVRLATEVAVDAVAAVAAAVGRGAGPETVVVRPGVPSFAS